MTAVRVIIEGRVQGVGFRYWTERTALALALAGWVRNRRDGAVEAVFEGRDEDVAAMVEACRRGPKGARVEALEEAPAAPTGLAGFEIRQTA